MKQYLKKYLAIGVFLSCLFSGFLGMAQTVNNEDSLDILFGLSEEVTCDNVTDILVEYNNTVQLLEDVFSQSLDNMYNFVDGVSKKGEISKSDLNRQKKQIQEAKDLVDKNKYQISQKGTDILFILQDCLNQ